MLENKKIYITVGELNLTLLETLASSDSLHINAKIEIKDPQFLKASKHTLTSTGIPKCRFSVEYDELAWANRPKIDSPDFTKFHMHLTKLNNSIEEMFVQMETLMISLQTQVLPNGWMSDKWTVCEVPFSFRDRIVMQIDITIPKSFEGTFTEVFQLHHRKLSVAWKAMRPYI